MSLEVIRKKLSFLNNELLAEIEKTSTIVSIFDSYIILY